MNGQRADEMPHRVAQTNIKTRKNIKRSKEEASNFQLINKKIIIRKTKGLLLEA